MDMIRANLVVPGVVTDVGGNIVTEVINDSATVPEELFRKYTETDSRPLTPAPTLASGPASTNRLTQEEFPVPSNLRERTTLVLDLRTNAQKQLEDETFTWHALTLEPPPASRKNAIFVSKPSSRRTSEHQIRSPNPPIDATDSLPSIDIFDALNSSRNSEKNEGESPSKEVTVVRRRGKRLRKGRCRRGSTYGQQIEVRDLFEPTETQISHIGDGSRRTSIHINNDDADNTATSPMKTSALSKTPYTMLPSFIDSDTLKHLCRELDIDKVEAEFSIRRKIAFEEALRVKGESYSRTKRSQVFSDPVLTNTPRVFSRKAARFEILGSESLGGLTVLEYLGKHVFVCERNKLIFGKVFNQFQEDAMMESTRCMLPNNVREALRDVIGKDITDEQIEYLNCIIGEVKQPLNFRTWCGLCAAAERLLCALPSKDADPSTWLERADFESLERRLKSTTVDPKLAQFLRALRSK